MGRIEINDLCYSCRGMYTEIGMTVEETLNTLYNDPQKWLECGGEVGIVTLLNKTIVLGDGCTRCGEKVLNRARELGLLPSYSSSYSSGNGSGIGKILKWVGIGVGVVILLMMCGNC